MPSTPLIPHSTFLKVNNLTENSRLLYGLLIRSEVFKIIFSELSKTQKHSASSSHGGMVGKFLEFFTIEKLPMAVFSTIMLAECHGYLWKNSIKTEDQCTPGGYAH